jgi:quercetin dioxygenase-like cupin family protein
MQITSFIATPEGGSRFVSLEVPFNQQRHDAEGHRIALSTAYASPAVQLVELPAGMAQDWHNAPARQIVVVLDGVIEVETTDGATLQWRTGEVFLPADVTGKGHRTRCIGGAVRLLFAPLPEGFAF